MSVVDQNSLARPLTLRRRPDLAVIEQFFGGRKFWVVRDPLSLRFVRLREGEFALFQALDGTRGLQDLVDLFEARFAPQRIKPIEVSRFVSVLYHAGLLLSDNFEQGAALYRRGRSRRARERRGRWLNPLALRFRGFDPHLLFQTLLPIVRPLLSKTGVVLSILFVFAAGLLVAVRWNEFLAKLPGFEQFAAPGNLLLLTLVMALLKILHELGHGLVCRRFGGECRELGLMLLVFTPCLYCDVTDAYRFPSKWRRIAVGAAGMFVELNLAAAATFLWWFSEPGLLNQLSLGVMTVASVSTLVFNGNPLMRYDGYYILADLVEIPNLAERSSAALRSAAARLLWNEAAAIDPVPTERHQGWLAAYAAASAVYRWLVTLSILLFLVAAARPYRLENLARLLGLLAVASLVIAPLVRLKRFIFSNEHGVRPFRSRAVYFLLGVAVLIALFAFLPLPHHVLAPLELQPADPVPLYVEVPGRLAEAPIKYGAELSSGTTIAKLTNPDLELGIEILTARRKHDESELSSLRREKFDNPSAALQIARVEKQIATTVDQLERKRRDSQRLRLSAPRAGTLFPPAYAAPHQNSEELHGWSGRPLDMVNAGATFDEGLLVGLLGDNQHWEASLVVDQEDVQLLRAGDHAEILLDALPGRIWPGRVGELSVGELRELPRRLSRRFGGDLSGVIDTDGVERPFSTSYHVAVRIHDPSGSLRQGWRGTAKIRVAPMSLGSRLWRSLSRIFHFDL